MENCFICYKNIDKDCIYIPREEEYFGEHISEKCKNCDNCNMGLKIKNNTKKVVENAIFFLLNYEPKSPSFIYKQLEEVIEKERLSSILKKMILEESILRDKNNLLYINL